MSDGLQLKYILTSPNLHRTLFNPSLCFIIRWVKSIISKHFVTSKAIVYVYTYNVYLLFTIYLFHHQYQQSNGLQKGEI